jgi:hypothetical protein
VRVFDSLANEHGIVMTDRVSRPLSGRPSVYSHGLVLAPSLCLCPVSEHHSHAVKHRPSPARALTQPTPDLHQKVVMKKHGSRLSEASPVWQKVSEKLKKSRLDCTCGDPVDMCIRSDDVTLGDASTGASTVVCLQDILSLTLLPPSDGSNSRVIFSFIEEESAQRLKCHVLLADPDVAEASRVRLSTSIRAAAARTRKVPKKTGVLGKVRLVCCSWLSP